MTQQPSLTVSIGTSNRKQIYLQRSEKDEKEGYRFRLTQDVLEKQFTYIEIICIDNLLLTISKFDEQNTILTKKKCTKSRLCYSSDKITTLSSICSIVNIKSNGKTFIMKLHKDKPSIFANVVDDIQSYFIFLFYILISVLVFILGIYLNRKLSSK